MLFVTLLLLDLPLLGTTLYMRWRHRREGTFATYLVQQRKRPTLHPAVTAFAYHTFAVAMLTRFTTTAVAASALLQGLIVLASLLNLTYDTKGILRRARPSRRQQA